MTATKPTAANDRLSPTGRALLAFTTDLLGALPNAVAELGESASATRTWPAVVPGMTPSRVSMALHETGAQAALRNLIAPMAVAQAQRLLPLAAPAETIVDDRRVAAQSDDEQPTEGALAPSSGEQLPACPELGGPSLWDARLWSRLSPAAAEQAQALPGDIGAPADEQRLAAAEPAGAAIHSSTLLLIAGLACALSRALQGIIGAGDAVPVGRSWVTQWDSGLDGRAIGALAEAIEDSPGAPPPEAQTPEHDMWAAALHTIAQTWCPEPARVDDSPSAPRPKSKSHRRAAGHAGTAAGAPAGTGTEKADAEEAEPEAVTLDDVWRRDASGDVFPRIGYGERRAYRSTVARCDLLASALTPPGTLSVLDLAVRRRVAQRAADWFASRPSMLPAPLDEAPRRSQPNSSAPFSAAGIRQRLARTLRRVLATVARWSPLSLLMDLNAAGLRPTAEPGSDEWHEFIRAAVATLFADGEGIFARHVARALAEAWRESESARVDLPLGDQVTGAGADMQALRLRNDVLRAIVKHAASTGAYQGLAPVAAYFRRVTQTWPLEPTLERIRAGQAELLRMADRQAFADLELSVFEPLVRYAGVLDELRAVSPLQRTVQQQAVVAGSEFRVDECLRHLHSLRTALSPSVQGVLAHGRARGEAILGDDA